MNADRLEQMKPGAWIINTARGPIIEEAALIDALRAGHLAGAGLDVFEVEPIEEDNPLLTMDNVMVAPHIAVYSEEGQIRASKRAAQIATAALNGPTAGPDPGDRQGPLHRARRWWHPDREHHDNSRPIARDRETQKAGADYLPRPF